MKIKVITAAYRGNERDKIILTPQTPYEGVEYIAYTNDPDLKVEPWVMVVEEDVKEMRLNARHKKTQLHKLHPDDDYRMWIDSFCKINTHPQNMVEKYLKDFDIVTSPHAERNNILEEGNVLLNWKPEQSKGLQEGVTSYLEDGYIPNVLYETKIIIQRNTPQIRKMQDLWWEEIQKHCIRDQMSFPYVIWKTGLAVNVFPGTHSITPLRKQNKPWMAVWEEVTQ